MYKVPNSRFLINQQSRRLVQQTRRPIMSAPVRKGGLSKLTIGVLFISAATMAYYNRVKKDNEFYNGDPYKKTIAESSDKEKDALNELNAAGKHIKNSINYAGQAAQDAFSNVQKEGETTINSLKHESEQFKQDLRSEVDQFASQHHLKEGDRNAGDVVSHDVDRATARTNANQAAFNAANKLKEAKENISKDVKKAADCLKDEKYKLYKTAQDHNPMVHEKVSSSDKEKAASTYVGGSSDKKVNPSVINPMVDEKRTTDKTKPAWEQRLETHANNVVHDTSVLVEKDTNKVKEVWNDTTNATANVKGEAKSFWSGLFGGGNDDEKKPATPQKKYTTYDHAPATSEGNPMVLEKRSREQKTKPLWETSLEEHAVTIVHDTSTLVDKDTEKVKKGVWEVKERANGSSVAQHVDEVVHEVEQEASSLWSSIFGSKNAKKQAESTWEDAKNKADDVKRDASNAWDKAASEADRSKSDIDSSSLWSSIFGSKANQATKQAGSTWKDAKNKADEVKRDVWDKTTSEAERVKSNVDDLTKKETQRLSSSWSNLKNQVSEEAEHLVHSAEDAAHSVANKFKSTTNDVKDKTSSDLTDLHKEISDNANKWKSQGEQKAKTWYEKSTDQVKSGFTSVKDEAGRLFGFGHHPDQEGLRGHIIRGEKYAEEEAGHLRATRSNTALKPARVVVEEAHGRRM